MVKVVYVGVLAELVIETVTALEVTSVVTAVDVEATDDVAEALEELVEAATPAMANSPE